MTTPHDQFADATWKTSSYSGDNNECVEVAVACVAVGVRDSKNPDGPTLAVPAACWTATINALRAGML